MHRGSWSMSTLLSSERISSCSGPFFWASRRHDNVSCVNLMMKPIFQLFGSMKMEIDFNERLYCHAFMFNEFLLGVSFCGIWSETLSVLSRSIANFALKLCSVMKSQRTAQILGSMLGIVSSSSKSRSILSPNSWRRGKTAGSEPLSDNELKMF